MACQAPLALLALAADPELTIRRWRSKWPAYDPNHDLGLEIGKVTRAVPADRKIANEQWSSMQTAKKTTKTTRRSEWRSLRKKDLTGPTWLEICLVSERQRA